MKRFKSHTFSDLGADAASGFKLTAGSPFWYEAQSGMGLNDKNRTFATVGRHQLGFRLARDRGYDGDQDNHQTGSRHLSGG